MDQTIRSQHCKSDFPINLPRIIYSINFRAIYSYSTASTSEAAYIIGGYHTREVIAEFKNSWRQLGTLAKGRAAHGTIQLGDEVMVIGGYTYDGRLLYFNDYFLIIDFFSDLETEIWNFGNETSRVVNPILPDEDYRYGIALFIVPFNFCTT